MGITRVGKYTEVPRSRASVSRALSGTDVVTDIRNRDALAETRLHEASAYTASSKSRAVSPSIVTNGNRTKVLSLI